MPTTPSTKPETAVTSVIAGATALVVGTDLFRGPPKPWKASGPVPRNCVFVYSMQSFRPFDYIGVGQALRDFRIIIFVRRQQDKFEDGQALARDIWAALHQAPVTSYGFVGCLMAESDPQYIGQDDTDDHRWVMTARLIYKG